MAIRYPTGPKKLSRYQQLARQHRRQAPEISVTGSNLPVQANPVDTPAAEPEAVSQSPTLEAMMKKLHDDKDAKPSDEVKTDADGLPIVDPLPRRDDVTEPVTTKRLD